MGVIALLRKLVGYDESDREVEVRFQERLNGVDEKNEELEELKIRLDGIIVHVDKKREDILTSKILSSTSMAELAIPEQVKVEEKGDE